MSGVLTIACKSAELTRDTETFGKMDPFVVVIVADHKFKSAVSQDTGKHPVWTDEFKVAINETHKEINFAVWDHDSASADDVIGEGTFQLSKFHDHHTYDGFIPLFYAQKQAGSLRVHMQFHPDPPSQKQEEIPFLKNPFANEKVAFPEAHEKVSAEDFKGEFHTHHGWQKQQHEKE